MKSISLVYELYYNKAGVFIRVEAIIINNRNPPSSEGRIGGIYF